MPARPKVARRSPAVIRTRSGGVSEAADAGSRTCGMDGTEDGAGAAHATAANVPHLRNWNGVAEWQYSNRLPGRFACRRMD
jgi:hypothetical protein